MVGLIPTCQRPTQLYLYQLIPLNYELFVEVISLLNKFIKFGLSKENFYIDSVQFQSKKPLVSELISK